jgi:hypothetical protein
MISRQVGHVLSAPHTALEAQSTDAPSSTGRRQLTIEQRRVEIVALPSAYVDGWRHPSNLAQDAHIRPACAEAAYRARAVPAGTLPVVTARGRIMIRAAVAALLQVQHQTYGFFSAVAALTAHIAASS